ncbi:MAG: VOC family protein [Pseudanabaena sp.]|jgi:lactoylglutathione lyase|nr:VOC family protein [Pseudanabaena sp. M090S1SP2A07QC]MCA6505195.1 VOC family protein [Pseudanabaena sp. M172S2SP2A07QC]MCA6510831.1 VOC family protein [Pseudanabaena sp. M109S1SP2A07QC]MCA6520963.1 VOC family protein [Pseudanabaena sp. M051S1SP2A07QC]MCA6526103.1 VOC family protein [Pseudanabaena sp. M179S2SP2A07QC]MCA6529300.1 VOC family protein [Pseudanabaena sp. M125S2SP2A07QC]MCA6533654.1 VOC family protein [Pseudanabaena sp. M176S2SP2A07QC]MCA6538297.1 VOC family protein [Pseudanabae
MEIDYIALFVSDVARSLIFYRDVLGFIFEKPAKPDGAEGYSGKLKIGIYDRSWLPKLFGDRGKQIISGNPFLLSMTVDNLDQVYQQICDRQTNILVDIISPPTLMPWGQKILFLSDPDGNMLEIVQSHLNQGCTASPRNPD